jgi:glycosyltransferase involved in cell wall biosynthesis
MDDRAQRPHPEGTGKAPAHKRTLAIFLPNLRGGGAERVVVNLARGLSERGIVVDVVLANAVGPFLSRIPSSVRIVDLHSGSTIASLFRLSRYLRQTRPAALLSALDQSNVVALLARRLSRVSTRAVIAVHSVASHRAANVGSLKARFYRMLMPRCYPWADAVVAVSHGVADDLCRLTALPRSRVTVVYNPVVEPDLHAKAAQPIDHPWFQPGEPEVILAVGNLSPWKDFGTLIRAFAIVRETRPVRLMILGEGSERRRLEALVQQLGLSGDVSLPGFVDNPYAYMSRAAAVVLCSKWEALPTVLIEAMALRIPVVSTDCDFGPREILAGGRYGKLTPVGDVEALARSICSSISTREPLAPKEALEPFGFETALEHYTAILFGERHG